MTQRDVYAVYTSADSGEDWMLIKRTDTLRGAALCANYVATLGLEAMCRREMEPTQRRKRNMTLVLNVGGEVVVLQKPSPLSLHSLTASDVDEDGNLKRTRSHPEFTIIMRHVFGI